MHAVPITPERLVGVVTDRVLEIAVGSEHPVRVAVDGASATGRTQLARELADRIRTRGRPVASVAAEGFSRPASVRLELGREDPDNLFERGLDLAALRREVLEPLGPGGSGEYLPVLWDVDRDRSPRAIRVPLAAGGVLILEGAFLLGAGLPLDVSVHLRMGPAALERRTPPARRWTLPAFARYAEEVDPTSAADVVVVVDDPRHPALVLPEGTAG